MSVVFFVVFSVVFSLARPRGIVVMPGLITFHCIALLNIFSLARPRGIVVMPGMLPGGDPIPPAAMLAHAAALPRARGGGADGPLERYARRATGDAKPPKGGDRGATTSAGASRSLREKRFGALLTVT